MRVQLIAFGKLKTPGLRDAAEHYLKLLRPWMTLQEIEIKPIPVPDSSAATRLKIQGQEAKLLLQRLNDGETPFYLLDEGGNTLSTLKWAEMIRLWEGQGSRYQNVALCIGSSLGFSDELRKKAEGILSFGSQTLAHELARIVLMEQIFRAWSVVRGHPYHREGQ